MRSVLGALLLLSLASCRGGATKPSGNPGPCTKSGDSCLFEPGKLGLCVEIEREAGPPTLVCQSQH